MADTKIDISGVRPDQVAAAGWATEKTLDNLKDVNYKQQTTLEAIAKRLLVREGRATTEWEQLLKDLGKSTDKGKRTADGLDQGAENFRNASQYQKAAAYQYLASVNDLRHNLTKISQMKPEDALNKTQDLIAQGAAHFSAKSKLVTGSLLALNTAITGLAFTFGLYAGAAKELYGLAEASITFGGSVEGFASQVRKTGLDLKTFSTIAQKYSQALALQGEEAFTAAIKPVDKFSTKLGMSTEQTMEYMGLYAQTLLDAGLVGERSQEKVEKGSKSYLTTLTALQVLTGKQRAQIAKEMQDRAKETKIRAAMMEISRTRPDEAQEIFARFAQLSQTSPEAANILMAREAGLEEGYTAQDQATLALIPGALESLQRINLSQPAQQFSEGVQGLQQAFVDQPDYLRRMQMGALFRGKGGLQPLAEKMFAPGGPLEMSMRQLDPKRIERYNKILAGGGLIDETAQQNLQIQKDLAQAQGAVASAAWDAAKNLGIFSGLLSVASSASGTLAQTAQTPLGATVGAGLGALGMAGSAILPTILTMRALRGISSTASGTPTPPGSPPGGTVGISGGKILGGSMLGGLYSGGMEAYQTGNLLKGAFVGGGAALGGLLGGLLGSGMGPVGTIGLGYAGSQMGESGGRMLYNAIFGPDAAQVTPGGAAAGGAGAAVPGATPGAGVGVGDLNRNFASMLKLLSDISANTAYAAKLLENSFQQDRYLSARIQRSINNL